MKLIIIAILALCLCDVTSYAQNGYTIKGAAVDTALRIKLYNTTISVLNAKDSVLQKFTRATDNGSFSLSGLPAGKFILLVTYPDYADYVETFTLDPKQPLHDFGNINLREKIKILQEVLIKGEVRAIKIKGDTTEFNPKAYTIQPNDKVEDLLKQLPGITIDKDGKITANGEAVTKVLVDGEEFFGDDPTLVTKNLRADMVSGIQLYDKKSDQAAFTGIDDGVKTKTINIKLKEDKKNGIFGKADVGVGTDGYYTGQLIFNKFKAKEKFSAYGTAANTGKISLGFDDNSKLGSFGNNLQIGDDGGISIFIQNDDFDSFNGTYNGNGLPLARTGGLHYDGKFDNDKSTLNTNYKIGSLEVTGVNTIATQLSSQNNTINTNTNRTFDNYAFRQKLDATYQTKLDTSTTLKVAADGTIKNTNTKSNYLTTSQNNTGGLINQETRNLTNNTDQKILNASALYTKKFKKPRRTFSWNLSEAYTESKSTGFLNSQTNYYNASGIKDSTQNVNQYKPTSTTSSVFSSNMTYSEPLTKWWSAQVNYGLGVNNTVTDRKSFNQSAPGRYDILDTTYSNNYKFNQLTNQGGIVFNYKKDKATFNFGTKASFVDFKQIDEYTGKVYRRNFINWLPQATYQYRFSQQSGFYAVYNGNTTQPTIDQIQPVRVNTDPLNITLGNANLKPAFTHRVNLNYNNYQVLSGQSFNINGSYTNTADAIVNNTTTDYTTGRSTTQYVNITDKDPYNYYLRGNISRKIKSIDLTVGLNLSTNGNVSYSYLNGLLNMSKTITYTGGLNLQKYAAKKYSFYASAGPTYTINEFSLQQQQNNNAAGFNTSGYATYYLPLKFIISSDVNYTYTARTQTFTALNKTILNASLSKTFLKDDNLKFSISANDLLDQNVIFSRSISGSSITQNSYNSIRRYFMFSVTWDFTKFGTIPAKN
jgi:hypothetical protein